MFAMIGLKLHLGKRFVPMKLTDEQRRELAEKTIANLTKHRDGWKLDEPIPEFTHGPR